jgi:hypothetical protein
MFFHRIWLDKCNLENLTEIFDAHAQTLYTIVTPMGSSRPALSGWTVVKTERNFPAV